VTQFDDFLAGVVRAAPGLRAPLATAGADVPDLEIPTSWLGDVGRVVTDAWNGLTESERDGVLSVAERALTSGSESLATAVATGFLESLVHAVSRRRIEGPDLARHLGPRSRAHLDAYDAFTVGGSSLGPS
jgi:hypothetical protein